MLFWKSGRERDFDRRIIEKGQKVIAVEKDEQLAEFLKTKFVTEINSGKLEIICGDILDKHQGESLMLPKEYKIIANIPYYITSHFCGLFGKRQSAVFDGFDGAKRSGGKNSGKKQACPPKRRGESSFHQRQGLRPAGNHKICAGWIFFPAPKVDSAVIKISESPKSFLRTSAKRNF